MVRVIASVSVMGAVLEKDIVSSRCLVVDCVCDTICVAVGGFECVTV